MGDTSSPVEQLALLSMNKDVDDSPQIHIEIDEREQTSGLLKLPVEVLLLITKHLIPPYAAALVLVHPHILNGLGYKFISDLDRTRINGKSTDAEIKDNEQMIFRRLMERDFLDHIGCIYCAKLHRISIELDSFYCSPPVCCIHAGYEPNQPISMAPETRLFLLRILKVSNKEYTEEQFKRLMNIFLSRLYGEGFQCNKEPSAMVVRKIGGFLYLRRRAHIQNDDCINVCNHVSVSHVPYLPSLDAGRYQSSREVFGTRPQTKRIICALDMYFLPEKHLDFKCHCSDDNQNPPVVTSRVIACPECPTEFVVDCACRNKLHCMISITSWMILGPVSTSCRQLGRPIDAWPEKKVVDNPQRVTEFNKRPLFASAQSAENYYWDEESQWPEPEWHPSL